MPQEARKLGGDIKGFLCDPSTDEFETVFCAEIFQPFGDVLDAYMLAVGERGVFRDVELVHAVVGGVGAVMHADTDFEETRVFSYDCYSTEHCL